MVHIPAVIAEAVEEGRELNKTTAKTHGSLPTCLLYKKYTAVKPQYDKHRLEFSLIVQ
jgi:hypothetical protein